MKKLNIFFLISYLLFIITLICMPLLNVSLLNYVSIILGGILSFLFIKFKNNFIITKKSLIIILIIGLVLRLSLLFFDFNFNVISDYTTFFENAINIANNEGVNTSYYSLFPYLYPYTFLLGIFMKIFGTTYISAVLLNILLDIIGGIFLYKLLAKITNKENKFLGIALYTLNPLSILFLAFPSPVIIVNVGIIILFYLSTFLTKKFSWISLLIGILISLFNSFRPILIILIIALVIYTVLKRLNYINLILIIISYLLTNFFIINILTNVLGTETSFDSGWSIYVGSNMEHDGSWNQGDASILNEVISVNDNPDVVHQTMKELGIERYINNGAGNVLHFIKKSHILLGDNAIYVANEFTNYSSLKISYLLIFINVIFITFISFLNLINSFNLFKSKNINYLIYSLFAIGLILATLIVEVSPRYTTPIYPSLIILASLIYIKDK